MQKRSFSRVTVRRKAGDSSRGWLIAGMLAVPVALGRGGIKANKREGDGGTPRGSFRLRQLWWRADKHPRPTTSLPVQRITPADGWCEDPTDRRYNRRIKVPAKSSADRLTRKDNLYDFIIELDHNTRPRVAGRGSAVFIHAARKGFAPTAGCVALELNALAADAVASRSAHENCRRIDFKRSISRAHRKSRCLHEHASHQVRSPWQNPRSCPLREASVHCASRFLRSAQNAVPVLRRAEECT